MAISILHNKVDQIPDWTQADLDAQIALGNFPPGTVLADIVLASDWNDDHSSPDLDILERNIRNFSIVDMGNADYTLTDSEAPRPGIAILNSGDGSRTLTIPTSSDGKTPSIYNIITFFAGSPFNILGETSGNTIPVEAPGVDIIGYSAAAGVTSLYNNIISDSAYSSSWDDSLLAPTKNAVYDALQTLPRNGAVTTLTFSDEDSNVTATVADTSIEANDYVSCVVIPNGLTAEEIVIQSITASADTSVGVGYTIHAAAPEGATGTIRVLTSIQRI